MPAATARANSLSRRWRNAEHAERRRMIVDVAMDLLRRRGIEQVTMRRVAHRLGVGAMTLYTYVNGQDELRRELTRRGFQMIHESCERSGKAHELDGGWIEGARAYLDFARHNPNLYEVMFSIPLSRTPADEEIFDAGFQPLIDLVKMRLMRKGMSESRVDELAHRQAAVYWVGLHGLATLAIAGRLDCPECNADDLLVDLLARVAPD
jgi:AcrR family transcriptional regulator